MDTVVAVIACNIGVCQHPATEVCCITPEHHLVRVCRWFRVTFCTAVLREQSCFRYSISKIISYLHTRTGTSSSADRNAVSSYSRSSSVLTKHTGGIYSLLLHSLSLIKVNACNRQELDNTQQDCMLWYYHTSMWYHNLQSTIQLCFYNTGLI